MTDVAPGTRGAAFTDSYAYVQRPVRGLDATSEQREPCHVLMNVRSLARSSTKEASMTSETAVRSNTEIVREYTQRVFNEHDPGLSSEYFTSTSTASQTG